MLRFPRSRVFEERISRARGEAPAGGMLTPRSKIALTAGFIVAAVGAILVGPQIGSVLANDDDHASFWRAEAARKAASRQAYVAQRAKPAPANVAKRDQLPRRASAYAPVQPQAAQRNQATQRNNAAQGPFWFFNQPGGPIASLSPESALPSAAPRAKAARSQKSLGKARQASSRHVCVRLCDGFFFPTPTGVSANDAGCASACPGAPTRLYSMRSDRISDAVSVRNGSSYSKLPVALHYTRVREQTCSCGATDPRSAIMTDASLRRGDRFMTEDGFLIYQGAKRSKNSQISRRDFTAVRETRKISKRERNLLLAMERVSLPRPSERIAIAPRPGTVVSLGPPVAPSRIALR